MERDIFMTATKVQAHDIIDFVSRVIQWFGMSFFFCKCNFVICGVVAPIVKDRRRLATTRLGGRS